MARLVATHATGGVSPHVAHQHRNRHVRAVDASAIAHPATDPRTRRKDVIAATFVRRPDPDAVLDTGVSSAEIERLEREWGLQWPHAQPSRPALFDDRKRSGNVCTSGRAVARRSSRRTPPKRRSARLAACAASQTATESEADQMSAKIAVFLEALKHDLASRSARRPQRSGRTAFDSHLNSLAFSKVLTRQEETQLFAVFNRCCTYGLSRTRLASAAELAAARHQYGLSVHTLRTIQQQSHQACSLLLSCNRRMVLTMARQMRTSAPTVALEDLVSEGEAGLLAAMLRFEVQRGFKFSTYSYWHIKQRIQRAIQAQSRAVPIPQTLHDLLPKVMQARAQLQQMLGSEADVTDEAVADALGLSAAKVKCVRRFNLPEASLDDASMGGGGNLGGDELDSRVDCIVDETEQLQRELEAKDVLIRECLNGVLHTLQPRERNIIRLRYGLNTERRRVSLPEVADAYGLSNERIRQIEEDAVRKLMVPWRRQALIEQTANLFEEA